MWLVDVTVNVVHECSWWIWVMDVGYKHGWLTWVMDMVGRCGW